MMFIWRSGGQTPGTPSNSSTDALYHGKTLGMMSSLAETSSIDQPQLRSMRCSIIQIVNAICWRYPLTL